MDRAPSIPRARADWLVALGLGIAAQLEVWIWWVEDEQGPRPLAAAALLLMSAALLWRRRAPMATIAAIGAVYSAWILIDTPAAAPSAWPPSGSSSP